MANDTNDLGRFVRELQQNTPGYWMHEASGVLAPVVRKYIFGGELDAAELDIMRAYLRQWVERGAWAGHWTVKELRDAVATIVDNATLGEWLAEADALGLDPL